MSELNPSGDGKRDALEAIILAELGRGDAVTMDQLMLRLPGLTWGEMFFALDALSRRGEIMMRRRGFEYEVCTPRGGLSQNSTTTACLPLATQAPKVKSS
jgi:hypothetical protein